MHVKKRNITVFNDTGTKIGNLKEFEKSIMSGKLNRGRVKCRNSTCRLSFFMHLLYCVKPNCLFDNLNFIMNISRNISPY